MDREEANKKYGIGVIGTIVAVLVAVIGVSIVWASYTSKLTVRGVGLALGSKWDISFKDLGDAVLGNSAGFAPTVKEIKAPSIVGKTVIEDFDVSVKTPGDYVSYTFKIRNDGNFPAKIDTGFIMPTPSCDGIDGDKVCDNLEYTLTYADGIKVRDGDKYGVGVERTVTLKLYYKESDDASQLPSTDVKISNLDVIIPFIQQ